MINLLTKSLDITDFFTNNELTKIAEVSADLSEHSKVTDIPMPEDYVNRKDSDFAAILVSPKGDLLQKFAMYNRGLVELNLAFLSELSNELPEELVKKAANNLTAAASNYEIAIPENLEKYASKIFVSRYVDILQIDEAAFITKLAGQDKVEDTKIYALKNKYPISTDEELLKSAEWFNKNYTKLDIDEIQEFVTNVNERIADTDVKLASVINDFTALNKEAFSDNLRKHLNIRTSYLSDDDSNDHIYDELWSEREDIGPLKTAYVLEAIDRELNLDMLYGDKILDPLRSTLSVTKVASIMYNGTDISQENLNSIKSDDLGLIVGEGLIEELKSNNGLTVFDSLPYPMKNEIVELI